MISLLSQNDLETAIALTEEFARLYPPETITHKVQTDIQQNALSSVSTTTIVKFSDPLYPETESNQLDLPPYLPAGELVSFRQKLKQLGTEEDNQTIHDIQERYAIAMREALEMMRTERNNRHDLERKRFRAYVEGVPRETRKMRSRSRKSLEVVGTQDNPAVDTW
jgi:hypothetical protein